MRKSASADPDHGDDDTAMNGDFSNPEFWIAMGIGLVSLGLFIVWLRTGGRRRSR